MGASGIVGSLRLRCIPAEKMKGRNAVGLNSPDPTIFCCELCFVASCLLVPTNVRCSFFALSEKGMHLEAKGPKEFDANTGVDLGFSRGGGRGRIFKKF